jgi:riboflavin kinase/FMN adenylyltransferase
MRPTVNDGQGVTVETVLSGFGGNLYGKEIRLEFIKFLREERAFAGVYELKAQIARDIDTIRFFVV